MKTVKFIFFCLLFVLISWNAIFCQENAEDFNIENPIIKFQAVPSDPVLDLLGVEQGNISKPGTMKKFLASLTSTTNISGKLINGVAISIAPYQIFKSENISLSDYISNRLTRILTNTSLSFGTAPSKLDDGSLLFGVGLKVQFLNSGDGRVDKKNIMNIAKKISNNYSHALTNDQYEKLKSLSRGNKKMGEYMLSNKFFLNNDVEIQSKNIATFTKAIDLIDSTHDQSSSKPEWNETYLDASLGLVWKAANSQIDQSSFEKMRIWVNGGLSLNKYTQLMLQTGLYKIKDVGSMKFSGAFMGRVGGETCRIGFGVSKDDFSVNTGIIAVTGEIQLSNEAWLVFSVDGNVEQGKKPVWIPSTGIKTSLGNLIF